MRSSAIIYRWSGLIFHLIVNLFAYIFADLLATFLHSMQSLVIVFSKLSVDLRILFLEKEWLESKNGIVSEFGGITMKNFLF